MSMYAYKLTIADHNRSAFGLGWEHRRDRAAYEHNPFHAGTLQAAWFQDGFDQFSDYGLEPLTKSEEMCHGV